MVENHGCVAYNPAMSHVARAAAAAAAMLLLWAAPGLAQTFELVMFERAGCIYCARWDKEVAPVYPLTADGKIAPLRRVMIDRQAEDAGLASPVRFSPTFVLLRDGKEAGRIIGYMNDETFWGRFSSLLRRQRESSGADAGP
jgi:hypothetical protein